METLRHMLDDFVVLATFAVVIYYMQLLERHSVVVDKRLRWTRRISLAGIIAGLSLLAYFVTVGEITLLLPGYITGISLICYFTSQILIMRYP